MVIGPGNFEPIISQHSTCLVVNPMQGCPKECLYCFLRQREQTGVRPVMLASPTETASLVRESPLNRDDAVLALYTCTDAFATPGTRSHLIALLDELDRANVQNPVTLITKCRVTEDVLEQLVRQTNRGRRVIVYLSYSGLDASIERGINHEQLRANFPLLHRHGIPVIHYWRPSLPQNSTPEVMTKVLEYVERYAACSVVSGLKIKSGSLTLYEEFWPGLSESPGVVEADGVFTPTFWEFIHHPGAHFAHYPIFYANACALAYVLGRSDFAAVHDTSICIEHSRCPSSQRVRCKQACEKLLPLDEASVTLALNRLGVVAHEVRVDTDERTVSVNATLNSAQVHALTQLLGARVLPERLVEDDYWTSRYARKTLPLVLVTEGPLGGVGDYGKARHSKPDSGKIGPEKGL